MKVPPGDKFCVYVHHVDGKIFYVGKGLAARVYDKTNRNHLWCAKSLLGYEGKVVEWFETEAEALRVEIELIQELKPECNMQHNGYRHTAETKRLMSTGQGRYYRSTEDRRFAGAIAVRCVETGDQFTSIAAASRTLGIAATSICKQLAGVDKYRRAGGFTFERVAS